MRNVVFVAPFPAETTMRFARALRALDVRLLGIVSEAPGGVDAGLFHDVVRVEDALALDQLAGALAALRDRHGDIHRLLAILEPLQEHLAELRGHFGIEGMDAETAAGFRDKAAMKDRLRAAGVGCARHALVTDGATARAFASAVGYPVVVKPPAGMACKATFQIGSDEALEQAVAALSEGGPVLVEEFLQGREHSFDAVFVGGELKAASMSQYGPSCLEVMRNDWIQWTTLLPVEPLDDAVVELGTRAARTLGLSTGMCHAEWFRRPDGSMAIGEVAARPPGAHFVRMIGLGHETSFYRVWARAAVDEQFDGPFSKRYAVGCAYLRGMGRGRVVAVEGLEPLQREIGELVVEAELPQRGAPKR
ncbi:MAG: ATP-grasp domain-containing protein, partial [Polyangiaceae bacterium]